MKIRKELFEHPDWWKLRRIFDLNETLEELHIRVNYLRSIEPNSKAMEETSIGDEIKLDYETIDEFRARVRDFYLSIDMGVNEKIQDGYYLNEENIKKDMLKGFIPFDKEWYQEYLDRTNRQ
jgi:hypothetical protein